jgi:hypothetical protein
MSEVPGQSRHALPDCHQRFVPNAGVVANCCSVAATAFDFAATILTY